MCVNDIAVSIPGNRIAAFMHALEEISVRASYAALGLHHLPVFLSGPYYALYPRESASNTLQEAHPSYRILGRAEGAIKGIWAKEPETEGVMALSDSTFHIP